MREVLCTIHVIRIGSKSIPVIAVTLGRRQSTAASGRTSLRLVAKRKAMLNVRERRVERRAQVRESIAAC